MSHDYDLVIRNGTLVDGTGAPGVIADLAVSGSLIAQIGNFAGTGREEIDAHGQLVTPGFVDVHTHYDGQVTWEDRMEPSSSHGVTTALMGNCGVGFAPCRAADRKRLVELMEGVEDVPEAVMVEGLPWNWETFPEYLDAVEGRKHDINIAAQLPHSCLRVYVMGERASNREAANAEDLRTFTRLTEEAMRAGALGVGTSRTIAHRDCNGTPIPTKDADEVELHAIAAGMKAAGHGVLEAVFDMGDLERDFEMLSRISRRWDLPVSFSLSQTVKDPDVWQRVLVLLAQARAEGLQIKAQVIGRPTGLHLGLELSYHPFTFYRSYQALSHLPLAERVREMRKPDVRARILAERPESTGIFAATFLSMFDWTFALGNPPNYEPPLASSIAAIAATRKVRPEEVAYDMLLEDGGHAILFVTVANYFAGNLDAALTMVKDENTILGLADGGAHYGIICDAGYPTFMLTYWTRDRIGEKLAIEQVVKLLARDPSVAIGLKDRGLIARGYRADLNIIDYANLRLHAPRVTYDLPAGGKRLNQTASGYTATIVGGRVTYRAGKPTGELPGLLVRGPQLAASLH